MTTAASASQIPGPAAFAADLPPVPAPITAPIDPADVHDAEVQLLRAIVAKQSAALREVRDEIQGPGRPYSCDSYLPGHIVERVVSALVDSELAQ